jgi:hypothetical protein
LRGRCQALLGGAETCRSDEDSARYSESEAFGEGTAYAGEEPQESEEVIAVISGAAYIVVGYTIRLVVYCVVYTAVYVYVIALVLDDKSERFFNREKRWPMLEKGDDSWLEKSDDTANYPPLLTEKVNQ